MIRLFAFRVLPDDGVNFLCLFDASMHCIMTSNGLRKYGPNERPLVCFQHVTRERFISDEIVLSIAESATSKRKWTQWAANFIIFSKFYFLKIFHQNSGLKLGFRIQKLHNNVNDRIYILMILWRKPKSYSVLTSKTYCQIYGRYLYPTTH